MRKDDTLTPRLEPKPSCLYRLYTYDTTRDKSHITSILWNGLSPHGVHSITNRLISPIREPIVTGKPAQVLKAIYNEVEATF